jgi:hypothetical protein
MTKKRSLPIRLIIGFGRFWWDFLVGDTPEIFLAVVATLVVTAVLSLVMHANMVAGVVLPVLVTLSLATSVARAANVARKRQD